MPFEFESPALFGLLLIASVVAVVRSMGRVDDHEAVDSHDEAVDID